MNGINTSNEDVVECPLCMEPLEVDDLSFFPCTCGYQICRFCWHRIRTDENELCPACRKAYPENPADFTPLTQEEIIAFKSQKKQRDQQRKQKITENRKHLANVRVVQKNLVFVVGLPPRLADADILKKHEYFGKYGKIHKVVINPSTTYAGVQGPSASAYVTYVHNNDALRAIQSVNNITIDGRQIKTSLGTTKYCSHFMKNQQCPKSDCMYLHELGDPEASFTKEEMHQGKHQEYEKRLHDALIATAGAGTACGMGVCAGSGGTTISSVINNGVGTITATTHSKTSIDVKLTNGSGGGVNSSTISPSLSLSISSSSTSSTSSSLSSSSSTSVVIGSGTTSGGQNKDVWPSLSVSPISSKDSINNSNGQNHHINSNGTSNNSSSNKTKKEKPTKNDNNNKANNKNETKNGKRNKNSSAPSSNGNNKDKDLINESAIIEAMDSAITTINTGGNSGLDKKLIDNKNDYNTILTKNDLNKSNHRQKQQQQQQNTINADDELKLFQDIEKKNGKNIIKTTQDTTTPTVKDIVVGNRSLSSSSSNSSDNTSTLSECTSGKSSPGSFSDITAATNEKNKQQQHQNGNKLSDDIKQSTTTSSAGSDGGAKLNGIGLGVGINSSGDFIGGTSTAPSAAATAMQLKSTIDQIGNNIMDANACFSKLNLFDDNNSFFSSSAATSFQQSLLFKGKLENDIRSGQQNSALNSVLSSHLPDLLNDFSNINSTFPNSTASDLSRLSQTALFQQQQQLLQQQDQQNQQGHVADHLLGSNLFGTNMSKFFDFHKNQQQIHHQLMVNGHGSSGTNSTNPLNDHLRFASLLENNRLNSQFSGQCNGILQQQQQQQQLTKQRLLNKYDPMVGGTYNLLMNLNSNSIINQQLQQQTPPQQSQQHLQQQQQNVSSTSAATQQQQSRLSNQFTQNSTPVDDDLGFDPFIETQKALAELMENEVQQNTSTQQSVNNKQQQQQQQQQLSQQHQHQLLENLQRTRMPPPGFNHMNAFGFGVPRPPTAGSKILPFMNMGGGGGGPTSQQQLQLQQQQNSWNPHLTGGTFQQQSHLQHSIDTQIHINQQQANSGNQNKGYSSNDWTAMDPAILSFRQFSSFPQQQQQQQQQQLPPMQPPHHPQQQQQQHSAPADMFMQHLAAQQQQTGFASQHHGGVNLAANILNQQQNTQSQVNFSHSNWLNSEQSLFMNSLTNGFINNNNNYDKFTIPMPPGIHQSNLNKQQKAECIN